MLVRILVRVSLLTIVGLTVGGFCFGSSQSTTVQCDEKALQETKAHFRALRGSRLRGSKKISDAEFRQAALDYVQIAEACYEEKYGLSVPTGQMIDEGGVWMQEQDGQFKAKRSIGTPPSQHNLHGTKWGTGTSFFVPPGSHPDATGPRIAGGTVTYSFMADGISLAAEMAGTNTAITSLATFDVCFLEEITDAFGAWSAVANIEFVPITDGGGAFDSAGGGLTGDIRIGAHGFDGASGILAHGFFPPPNGISAAGDIHFDIAESWACDPTLGGLDFGLVSLHEIGHAIGLRHEEGGDVAVMEPSYNPALTFGPVADDIIGAGEIYGGSPIGSSFFFGDVGIGTDDPTTSLHVLRDDGTARLRVEETATTPANRTLLRLVNNGTPRMSFLNTNNGAEWFMNSIGSDFQFLRVGSTTQLRFFSGGRLRVTNSSNAQILDLSSSGDLTITGDITANGMFYASDRNLKEGILPVDPDNILQAVAKLPVASWRFGSDPDQTRHIGPMAQDFYALFGVGIDDKHISPLDVASVGLAAIQSLKREVESQKEEIRLLKAQLAKLVLKIEEGSR